MTERRPARTVAIFTAIALLAAFPGLARGQGGGDATTEAKQLFIRGNAQYDAGYFDQALKLYEKSYALAPRPTTLFNMAQCHRQLKNYERALFLYGSYLRQSPNAPNRAEVEALIADLEKLIEEQRRTGKAPPSAPLGTPPGTGASAPPVASAPPAAPAPTVVATTQDAPGPRRPFYKRWYFWAAVGAVVVGGVVGGVVAGRGGNPADPSSTHGTMTFTFGR